ncbi:hypothetical protein GCM10009850_028360 [Nonomuraea monospora]|uniref:Uncharacterized protein n=1 Tax=Nonomuraea monospora TaxID=568818 RepID=A0ABP5PA55_9ACTN
MSDQQQTGSGQQQAQQPAGAGAAQQQGQQPAATTQQIPGTGQLVYSTTYGGMPVAAEDPKPPSSHISFSADGLDVASQRIDAPKASIDSLRAKSGDLGVPFPSFGVIGYKVAIIHDKAIERHSSALEEGNKALESWKVALKKAAANYRDADDAGGAPPPTQTGPDPTLGPGPGLDGTPGPEMPEMPEADPSSPDLPDAGLPDAGLPDSGLPDSGLPDTDLPNTDLPGTDSLSPDLPDAGTPGTDLPTAQVPSAGSPDDLNTKVPDLDSVLNPQQDKTDLSSFDPRTQQPNGVPNPSLVDTSTRPGTTYGSPTGSGAGAGLRPSGMSAAGSMGSGMPMMPMMPMSGAANGNDERDREGSSLLSQDEGVWDGDEDIAPEVIGQER